MPERKNTGILSLNVKKLINLHLVWNTILPFWTPLTQNEYTVTDSFHFAEEICKQDPNLYMASLDVDSLFTNIPLDETINICIDSLYKDDENTPKIPKDVFRNLLTWPPKNRFLCLTTN